jgi:hypothetical protein
MLMAAIAKILSPHGLVRLFSQVPSYSFETAGKIFTLPIRTGYAFSDIPQSLSFQTRPDAFLPLESFPEQHPG